jgi:hypothetical protein
VNLVLIIAVVLPTEIYLLSYLSKNYLCFIDRKKLRSNLCPSKNNLHLRLVSGYFVIPKALEAKPKVYLNKRYYSSMLIDDREFITGFVDAEGSFVVSIKKSSKYKTG